MAAEAEYRVDFPTLFVAADWIANHCIVPDGFDKGEPFELVDWQLWSLLNFYRLRPGAQVGELGTAFHFRRSQIVLPQKAGKAPYTAAHICVEGVGPALFAGWAKGGETWDCRDHGCPCGWVHEYEPGEAMGMNWPTPLIQITATSDDQTENVYDALRPMIDDGPLHELIPKTGEEFIRLPGKGRIDTVTSNARSRLGQRVTFVPQDETGLWSPRSGMVKVAETQRRGLAGMGGRAEETTNAWDPTEESVAQRTADSKRPDIFRLHPEAPPGLSYTNKRERRKIHRVVYQGCKWVDLDAIEGEAAELLETDPAQAERFFGNRVVAGSGKAFDFEKWKALANPTYSVDHGAFIAIGVDGARFQDALAVVATEIDSGHQWPLGIWERPEGAGEGYEHPMDEVDAVVTEAVETLYKVWRIYIDPGSTTGNITPLMEKWQGRWGDPVVPWSMQRPRITAFMIASYTDAIATGELSHDGDPLFAAHIGNATKRKVLAKDERGEAMHVISKSSPESPDKIDAAAAGALSWEARGDAVADDATEADAITKAPSTVIFAGI